MSPVSKHGAAPPKLAEGRPLPPATPRLLALATAVPPYRLDQRDVVDRVARLFPDLGGELERMLPVFSNAGIDVRYSCVPMAWYDAPHGWAERNQIYLDRAVDLLHEVAGSCLEQAALKAEDIDAIVLVSTTGIATPSLDARLMGRLPFRSDVERLPIFGLGCAGGVLGLSRAAALARARPQGRILFLTVELCALAFRIGDYSKSNLVATALFGDGAAGAVLDGGEQGPRLTASGEHTWPDSLDIMGWAVEQDGLRAIFSRSIPTLVETELRNATEAFLARHDLALADIDRFVCHPGGAKVLTALERTFDLGQGALNDGRAVLRDYGNMSAVTVLFVLARALAEGVRGRLLLIALGPGFTAGFQLIEVE